MPEEEQIYTAIPLRKGDEAVTDSNTSTSVALLEEPLLDVESQFEEYTDEEEELWEDWPYRWWSTIVTGMICMNTLATYFILQDQINGVLVSGSVHTLIEMISLEYIVNCPGTILLYFLFNIHRDQDNLNSPTRIWDKLFILFVTLITLMQNYIVIQVFMHVYG